MSRDGKVLVAIWNNETIVNYGAHCRRVGVVLANISRVEETKTRAVANVPPQFGIIVVNFKEKVRRLVILRNGNAYIIGKIECISSGGPDHVNRLTVNKVKGHIGKVKAVCSGMLNVLLHLLRLRMETPVENHMMDKGSIHKWGDNGLNLREKNKSQPLVKI